MGGNMKRAGADYRRSVRRAAAAAVGACAAAAALGVVLLDWQGPGGWAVGAMVIGLGAVGSVGGGVEWWQHREEDGR